MKKILALAAFVFAFSFGMNANAQDVLVGTYTNSVGKVVISNANAGEKATYNVAITDTSGKCNVNIVASTYNDTATGKNGATFHPNTIASVESQTYPNFSLWPEDQTIRLADDALPLDKLDPACQAFRGNMVFTRQN